MRSWKSELPWRALSEIAESVDEMPEQGADPTWVGMHDEVPLDVGESPLPPPVATVADPLLVGESIGCQCPECGAPLAIRRWLGVVDCWSCETAVAVDHLPDPPLPRTPRLKSAARPGSPAPPTPKPAPARRSATSVHQRPPAPQLASRRPATAVATSYDSAGLLSPWLISLIVHVILLTLLGLIQFPQEDGPGITLSAIISDDVREGEDDPLFESPPEAEFDLPVPNVDLKEPAVRRAVAQADQEAKQLRVVEDDNPYLEPLPKVASRLQAPSRSEMVLSRDPRLRVEVVKQEGGTTLTEAAVARGLRWLALHQSRDGSWSLSDFHRAGRCSCDRRSGIHNRHVATALALLPFLGAGQTHLTGVYRDEVSRGLRWLLDHQSSQGDLRGSRSQTPGMYGHGQAAVVLCEAYLMTGDEALKGPAQRAIDFIVAAQYDDGGWRYFPRDEARRNEAGDTSVVGWQLMALQSGLAAGLKIPDVTLEAASHFLDLVQSHDGSRYGYQRRRGATPTMTAEALLCRMYLGWQKDRPALREGLDYLLAEASPRRGPSNMYYWYYATQVFHHYGGSRWHQWNIALRDRLVAAQERRGHAAGSWAPRSGHDTTGGRLYMTALAVCTLEVYYRHLPIFRALDLEPTQP